MAASASASAHSKRHHAATAAAADDDVVVLLEGLHTPPLPKRRRINSFKPDSIPTATTVDDDDDDDVVVLREVRPIVIPDEDDCYEIPHASTSAIGGGNFSLYFKGLVVEDGKKKTKLGAIGIAIFDSKNAVVAERSEPLASPEGAMTEQVADLEAFVHGLELAWSLEIRILMCASLHFDLDSYETKEAREAHLVGRARFLKKRFRRCRLSKIEKNADLVLQLARSSIASQAGRPFEEVIRTQENCPICLEDIDSKKMIQIDGCPHRFCSSCLKTHVELKVQGRELPRCPQPSCGLELKIDSCRKLLARKMYKVLDQLVKESSIPTTEKVYCPNPRCSYLMSKTEALETNHNLASTSTMDLTACRCLKCRKLFCINCKVLWHSNLSCDAYKKVELDDDKLMKLAQTNKWKQCPKCHHMVARIIGCDNMICRCRTAFCYSCGRQRKGKTSCSCLKFRGGTNGR